MPLLGLKKTKQAVIDLSKKANINLKGVYLVGLDNIMGATPADTGRARNNWFLTVGSPSSSTTTVAGGGQEITLPKNVLGKKLYFTNNLPYIETLEYGGYPDPVKKGSYIKRSNSFEKLSQGGFSKQIDPANTPKGWVRAELIRMQNKIRALN